MPEKKRRPEGVGERNWVPPCRPKAKAAPNANASGSGLPDLADLEPKEERDEDSIDSWERWLQSDSDPPFPDRSTENEEKNHFE